MPQLDRSRASTAKLLTLVVDGDYYGGSSAAVPFKWESQPGTPRRFFKRSSSSGFDSDSDSYSPVSAPLTPPPSYFYASPSSTNPVSPKKPNTRFGSLLSKNHSSPSSPASSSVPRRRNKRKPVSFESASSLAYGSNHNNSAKSSGCYASIVKVLLLRDVK